MKVPIFTKTRILVLHFLIVNKTKRILKHKRKNQSVWRKTIENPNKAKTNLSVEMNSTQKEGLDMPFMFDVDTRRSEKGVVAPLLAFSANHLVRNSLRFSAVFVDTSRSWCSTQLPNGWMRDLNQNRFLIQSLYLQKRHPDRVSGCTLQWFCQPWFGREINQLAFYQVQQAYSPPCVKVDIYSIRSFDCLFNGREIFCAVMMTFRWWQGCHHPTGG